MTGADREAGAGAVPPRPTWLTETCPPWCARGHEEEDHPEDRYHQSEPSTFPAIAGPGDAVPMTASLGPTTLAVRLGRHVGDERTWLAIESLDTAQPRVILTEDSARSLLRRLQAQLTRASNGHHRPGD